MGRSLLLLLVFLGSFVACPVPSVSAPSSVDCLACGATCCCAASDARCECLAPAEPAPAPTVALATGLRLPVCLDGSARPRISPQATRLALPRCPAGNRAHPVGHGLLLEQLDLPPPA